MRSESILAPGIDSLDASERWQDFGVWRTRQDILTRGYLREGRMSGFFNALFGRVRHFVSKKTASTLKQAGLKPLLITVGGEPLQLSGLPPEWEQKDRAYYSSGHPVLVIYGSRVDDHGSISDGEGERVCSVGELTDQLEREKANWRFYVGTIMTALLSVALIILRFAMKGAEH